MAAAGSSPGRGARPSATGEDTLSRCEDGRRRVQRTYLGKSVLAGVAAVAELALEDERALDAPFGTASFSRGARIV
jgi:hypothetical protein